MTTTTDWATEQGYTGADNRIITRRIRVAERQGLTKAEILTKYAGNLLADRAMRDWAKGR